MVLKSAYKTPANFSDRLDLLSQSVLALTLLVIFARA
jgi:hypothetical protein